MERIEPEYATNMEITIPLLPNVVATKTDNSFWMTVYNANSFHFMVVDGVGSVVHKSAGLVTNNHAALWDNVPIVNTSTAYWYRLVFRNNYGRIYEINKYITLLPF